MFFYFADAMVAAPTIYPPPLPSTPILFFYFSSGTSYSSSLIKLFHSSSSPTSASSSTYPRLLSTTLFHFLQNLSLSTSSTLGLYQTSSYHNPLCLYIFYHTPTSKPTPSCLPPCRYLLHFRYNDTPSQYVALKLHKEGINIPTSVDPQFGRVYARIFLYYVK